MFNLKQLAHFLPIQDVVEKILPGREVSALGIITVGSVEKLAILSCNSKAGNFLK